MGTEMSANLVYNSIVEMNCQSFHESLSKLVCNVKRLFYGIEQALPLHIIWNESLNDSELLYNQSKTFLSGKWFSLQYMIGDATLVQYYYSGIW